MEMKSLLIKRPQNKELKTGSLHQEM